MAEARLSSRLILETGPFAVRVFQSFSMASSRSIRKLLQYAHRFGYSTEQTNAQPTIPHPSSQFANNLSSFAISRKQKGSNCSSMIPVPLTFDGEALLLRVLRAGRELEVGPCVECFLKLQASCK